MDTVNLFRVELNDVGVYHAYGEHDAINKMFESHSRDYENHPTWANDGMGFDTTLDHWAACETPEKLFSWFRGHWAGFNQAGCEVKKDFVLFSKSGKQVAFNSNHATLQKAMTIKEFLKMRKEKKNEKSLRTRKN